MRCSLNEPQADAVGCEPGWAKTEAPCLQARSSCSQAPWNRRRRWLIRTWSAESHTQSRGTGRSRDWAIFVIGQPLERSSTNWFLCSVTSIFIILGVILQRGVCQRLSYPRKKVKIFFGPRSGLFAGRKGCSGPLKALQWACWTIAGVQNNEAPQDGAAGRMIADLT
jgi:hypothetical protein